MFKVAGGLGLEALSGATLIASEALYVMLGGQRHATLPRSGGQQPFT